MRHDESFDIPTQVNKKRDSLITGLEEDSENRARSEINYYRYLVIRKVAEDVGRLSEVCREMRLQFELAFRSGPRAQYEALYRAQQGFYTSLNSGRWKDAEAIHKPEAHRLLPMRHGECLLRKV